MYALQALPEYLGAVLKENKGPLKNPQLERQLKYLRDKPFEAQPNPFLAALKAPPDTSPGQRPGFRIEFILVRPE